MNSIEQSTASLWTWLFPSPESRAAQTQAKVEQVVKALAPAVEVQFSINPTGETS